MGKEIWRKREIKNGWKKSVPKQNGAYCEYCCTWVWTRVEAAAARGACGIEEARCCSGCSESECLVRCAFVLNLSEQCGQANGRIWSCTMRVWRCRPSLKPKTASHMPHLNGLTFWCTLRICKRAPTLIKMWVYVTERNRRLDSFENTNENKAKHNIT